MVLQNRLKPICMEMCMIRDVEIQMLSCQNRTVLRRMAQPKLGSVSFLVRNQKNWDLITVSRNLSFYRSISLRWQSNKFHRVKLHKQAHPIKVNQIKHTKTCHQVDQVHSNRPNKQSHLDRVLNSNPVQSNQSRSNSK